MVINKFNFQLNSLNSLNLHDDIFNSLNFDYNVGNISISATNVHTNREYNVDFVGVVGFEMSNCDFWGFSPHIFDFECLEENEYVVLPKLFKQKDAVDSYFSSKLDSIDNYMEVVMTLSSGDTLRIACKYISISKM